MSNTDSFIDEVTEEVRRDRLFALIRRYGWIAALAVVLIVGGAAWVEYRKAQEQAAAERLGDALVAALTAQDASLRESYLADITPTTPEARAIVAMLTASDAVQAGQRDKAIADLDAVSTDAEVPDLYRQIAAFKSLTLQATTLPEAELRQQLEALAVPGSPLRLLAVEQLALADIRGGDADGAIARYQSIIVDAEVTADLQQRALQVIVSLGGSPDLGSLMAPAN